MDFEHVRGKDRERLGWIRMTADEKFQAFDLLWRPVSEPDDLAAAEAALEARGLGYLATDWWLDTAAGPQLVQIAEVAADSVTVAPVLATGTVAKALDLDRRVVLPNPTDRLAEA